MASKIKEKAVACSAAVIIALSPFFAKAQAIDPPVVPFNGASMTANHSLTLAMRPPEIGTSVSLNESQITGGLLANYKMPLNDKVTVGASFFGSSTVTFQGNRTNVLVPTIGIGINTVAGSTLFGVKMNCNGKGDVLAGGPVSVLALQQNQIGKYLGKLGVEYTNGTENYKRAATMTLELVRGSIGTSATIQMIEKSKAKLSSGIEKGLGNGWQAGISIHPEGGFLRGKANPQVVLRKVTDKSTMTGTYSPQQKQVKLTVGYRL